MSLLKPKITAYRVLGVLSLYIGFYLLLIFIQRFLVTSPSFPIGTSRQPFDFQIFFFAFTLIPISIFYFYFAKKKIRNRFSDFAILSFILAIFFRLSRIFFAFLMWGGGDIIFYSHKLSGQLSYIFVALSLVLMIIASFLKKESLTVPNSIINPEVSKNYNYLIYLCFIFLGLSLLGYLGVRFFARYASIISIIFGIAALIKVKGKIKYIVLLGIAYASYFAIDFIRFIFKYGRLGL